MNLPLSPASLAAAPDELFFGNGRAIIRASRLAGEDFCVIEHHLPHGDAPPLHIHRGEDEFFHLIEGRMRFRFGDGRQAELEPGQSLLAPKGVAHGYRVTSPEGARCLTLTTGTDFEGMVREMSRPATRPGPPPFVEPTAEMIFALGRACARHRIEVIGAPIR